MKPWILLLFTSLLVLPLVAADKPTTWTRSSHLPDSFLVPLSEAIRYFPAPKNSASYFQRFEGNQRIESLCFWCKDSQELIASYRKYCDDHELSLDMVHRRSGDVFVDVEQKPITAALIESMVLTAVFADTPEIEPVKNPFGYARLSEGDKVTFDQLNETHMGKQCTVYLKMGARDRRSGIAWIKGPFHSDPKTKQQFIIGELYAVDEGKFTCAGITVLNVRVGG